MRSCHNNCLNDATRQEGLEPPTNSLEGCRSIHLSYWRLPCRWSPSRGPEHGSTSDPPHLTRRTTRSGRPDSNRRPPAPKAGAIPGYATPRRSAAAHVILLVRRGQRGLANPLQLPAHTTRAQYTRVPRTPTPTGQIGRGMRPKRSRTAECCSKAANARPR